MEIDDDDDFYAPEEPTTTTTVSPNNAQDPTAVAPERQQQHEDLEEGEEEDEGADMDEDDSDIDIITERKDGTKAPPPTQSRYSDIRNIPQRTTSSDATVKPAIKRDDSQKSPSDADLPPASTSKIDVNAIPVYKIVGKPITQVNIDEDLPENDKPWRKPGTDISDYFNYGFDEFAWATYAAKQDSLRAEYSQDAMAQSNKKLMEEMQMIMMGGMPGMGGGAGAGSMPNLQGMDAMPPEMQAMMQQMVASGMDPSQMDPSAMSSMFAGMQNAGGNTSGTQSGQNQHFGASAQGFGGNQSQGYGFDQGMGRGGGGGGNFGGRGRGGRRNW